jgi:hypothetical protein
MPPKKRRSRTRRKKKMTNSNFPETVSELYPRQWFGFEDLAGKRKLVKVVGVSFHDFTKPTGEKERAAILHLEGETLRLIMNKTRCLAMAKIVGSERFADWPGHEIVLAPGRAKNGKDTIAILPPSAAPLRPAPTPPAPANVEPLPEVVASWQKPEDAYDWAISIGAAENVFSARAAFAKAVDAHGGRLTRQNASAVYLAFYQERLKRAEEKKAQAQEEVANLTLDLVEAMSPDAALAQALAPAPAQVEDVFA